MYTHKVHYYETDKMGITHHSNYVRWMEEARIDMLTGIGWDYEKIEGMGIISPVVGVSCRYMKTTTFADVINIDVIIAENKGAVLRLDYVMTNQDGAKVCEAHSDHCFLTLDGKPISIKRKCPEFYEALKEVEQKGSEG